MKQSYIIKKCSPNARIMIISINTILIPQKWGANMTKVLTNTSNSSFFSWINCILVWKRELTFQSQFFRIFLSPENSLLKYVCTMRVNQAKWKERKNGNPGKAWNKRLNVSPRVAACFGVNWEQTMLSTLDYLTQENWYLCRFSYYKVAWINQYGNKLGRFA